MRIVIVRVQEAVCEGYGIGKRGRGQQPRSLGDATRHAPEAKRDVCDREVWRKREFLFDAALERLSKRYTKTPNNK